MATSELAKPKEITLNHVIVERVGTRQAELLPQLAQPFRVRPRRQDLRPHPNPARQSTRPPVLSLRRSRPTILLSEKPGSLPATWRRRHARKPRRPDRRYHSQRPPRR